MKLFKNQLSTLNSQLSTRHGFTLVELLVVIAIIGVLATILLIAINPANRVNSGKNAKVRADFAILGSAANIFNTDTGLAVPACTGGGSYPSTFNQSVCGGTFPANPGNPAYTLEISPAFCAPNTATPCTAISIEGVALSDGVIDASVNNRWCLRSATGLITQTTAAGCFP